MTENFTWPLVFLLVAVFLLVLEMFIPSGGLLSVLSGLAFLAAVITAFVYGGMGVGTAFLAGVGVLVPLLLFLAIRYWPKTPIGKKILIQPPTDDEILPQNIVDRQQWLGQQGIAVTPMLPSGAFRIGGQTLDAISDGVSIEKGAAVEVHAIRGNHLVVRPAVDSPSSSTGHSLDEVVPDPFDDSLS